MAVTLSGVLVVRRAERKIVGWVKLNVFVSKYGKMKINKNNVFSEFLDNPEMISFNVTYLITSSMWFKVSYTLVSGWWCVLYGMLSFRILIF